MAAQFVKNFEKTANAVKAVKKFMNNSKQLDHAGLALLTAAPAYHGYKAIKDKDKGSAIAAGTEVAGLGLLARAVSKGH